MATDADIKSLIGRSDKILDGRWNLLSLWQSLAENFYPQRADFTVRRDIGDELNDNLYSSYPIMVRRDMGDALSVMLRQKDKQWFHITTGDERAIDTGLFDLPHDAKLWLEEKEQIMHNIMYRRGTNLERATKEGDMDFTTFGNAVLQLQPNKDYNGIVYRDWHLRDCGWVEDIEGEIIEMHRKWDATASDLVKFFGEKNVHHNINDCIKNKRKDTYQIFKVRHMMMPTETYHDNTYSRFKFVSMWVDVDNEHVMEERGSWNFEYIVPRWATVAGCQYAHSPAAITALPDARLIQQMSRVILDAGEKTANPPMIATEEMVTSAINLYAGGVTWADADYDEKLGEVLRPVTQNYSGLPIGIDLQQQTMQMVSEAFYLSKLTLPPPEANMTAYEVSRRVEEYIRQARPLFEPMEKNYNGRLCEETFAQLMDMGAFGSPREIPQALRSKEIEFKFESPLHQSIEEVKATKFAQAAELLRIAVEMDQTAFADFEPRKAFRDALEGIAAPQNWITDEKEAEREAAQFLQQRKTAEALEAASMAGDAMQKVGDGQKALPAPTG